MSTMPLEQAAAVAKEVLSGVSAEHMSAPTPCASWDVAGLINHLIGAQGFFLSGLEGTPPSGEQVDFAAGDFAASFDEASGALVAGFGADGAMERMLKLPFGEMPGAAFMGLAVNDTFTHAWDLAKATGQSTDLAPELAEMILAQARASIQESFRGAEGAPFGPEAECPEGASKADELAAFLGREV